MSEAARPGALTGQVASPTGTPISSVAIAVIAPDGQIKFALSGARGRFVVSPLTPGRYTIWAWSKGFALYQIPNLRIAAGHKSSLDILLRQEPADESPDGAALIAARHPDLLTAVHSSPRRSPLKVLQPLGGNDACASRPF